MIIQYHSVLRDDAISTSPRRFHRAVFAVYRRDAVHDRRRLPKCRGLLY